MPTKVSKKVVGMIIRSRKTIMKDGVMTVRCIFLLFLCMFIDVMRSKLRNVISMEALVG